MRAAIIIFIILFGFGSAQSQVPGYLGKRFTITAAELLGSPTGGYSYPKYGYDPIINIQNYTRFACDYAVGNKTMLGVSYSFGSMGYRNDIYNYPMSKLSVRAFEFRTKLFLGDHIAPLGKYISMGFSIQNIKETDPLNYSKGYNFKEYSTRFLSFHFGFGANFFINDFLFFTPSFESNFHFQSLDYETIQASIAHRWQVGSYALLGIGVGVLVF